jgi:DNA recombination protein RmuC
MGVFIIAAFVVGVAVGIAAMIFKNGPSQARTEEQLRVAQASNADLQTRLAQQAKVSDERGIALAAAKAEAESEKKHAAQQLALVNEAKEEMAARFKNLANEILEEKSQKFTTQNEVNLKQVLDPIKTKLSEFQSTVERAYVAESKDRSALAQQVTDLTSLNQQLSKQAHDLTTALKGSVKIQGNWGELLLEKILEGAGLRRGYEYDLRGNYTHNDGSRGQPDVVLNLPESRHIVIDSKVSLVAYSDYMNAQTDTAREDALARHISSLRAHIKGLSGKNYQDLLEINSPDFVLMFVPIEAAFSLAISKDDDLWRDAYKKNVLLVSPVNLLFVLRTVSNLWNAEVQRQYVADVMRRGAELYDKFAGFVESMQDIGYRLDQAQASYSEAMGRLKNGRGNLLRQAEQLKEFGIKPKKNLPEQLLDEDDEVEAQDHTAVQLKIKSIAAKAGDE